MTSPPCYWRSSRLGGCGCSAEQRAEAWDRAIALARTSVDLVFFEEAPAPLLERIRADGELLAER